MNFERQFVVGAEGTVEEKKLSESKKEALNKPEGKRKLLSLEKDRTFSVGPDGSAEIIGDDKEKLREKKI